MQQKVADKERTWAIIPVKEQLHFLFHDKMQIN